MRQTDKAIHLEKRIITPEDMRIIRNQGCLHCSQHYVEEESVEFARTRQGLLWWHIPRCKH